jgi:hypothetical protein
MTIVSLDQWAAERREVTTVTYQKRRWEHEGWTPGWVVVLGRWPDEAADINDAITVRLNWCREQCTGRWQTWLLGYFFFESERDAILFRLHFC